MITEELRRVDADVVCIQEVWAEVGGRDNAEPPSVHVDAPGARSGDSQPARLADACGYDDWRFAWRYAHDGLAFGNAILSRWPVTEAVGYALPTEPGFEEHRTALLTVLDTPDGALPVATTHLNFRWDQSDIRCLQVEGVCRFLSGHAGGPLPVILTGDLNAESSSAEIRKLNGRAAVPVRGLGFFDAWEVAGDGDGHTWTRANTHAAQVSLEADRRIDYVLVGYPDMQTRAGRVVGAQLFGTTATAGMHPTDHFGVMAELSA